MGRDKSRFSWRENATARKPFATTRCITLIVLPLRRTRASHAIAIAMTARAMALCRLNGSQWRRSDLLLFLLTVLGQRLELFLLLGLLLALAGRHCRVGLVVRSVLEASQVVRAMSERGRGI